MLALEITPLPATGSSREISLHGDQSFVSRSGDVFVTGEHRLEREDILNGPARLRSFIRSRVYDAVHGAREEQFQRNEILLDAANINVHDTEHQDRDARIVAFLFNVFADKLNADFREPVLAGAMMHDREYIPAARAHALHQLERLRSSSKTGTFNTFQEFTPFFNHLVEARDQWTRFLSKLEFLEAHSPEQSVDLFSDDSFPVDQIGKKELDPHAELGEKKMREWCEDPAFAEAFGDWTPEQKEMAALTVRDHSNGSAYNPFTTPREVQALRLADKLDNTHHRIRESMLTKESLQDPNNCHRFVPASIRSYDIEVNRDTKTFTVGYDVDFGPFLALMHRDAPDFTYGKEDFLRDFHRAYGEKSMRIAAEVVHGLFADATKGEMYGSDATFRTAFRFADGTTETTTHVPLVTSPRFG